MQESFHAKVVSAAKTITKLLPSYISSCVEEEKNGFVDITLNNPFQEDKPIWISTAGEEITFAFAESHFHIDEYTEDTTHEALIEEMITTIVRIVTGVDLTYSAWINEKNLGGGFIEVEPKLNEIQNTFKSANLFKVWGWDNEDNNVIDT